MQPIIIKEKISKEEIKKIEKLLLNNEENLD